MSLPQLSEAYLLRKAGSRSFQRGRDYYEAGAVITVTKRGCDLIAQVEGSRQENYWIQISIDGSDISARCTCPYDGGWCKHIVAALLTCLHDPDSVAERPSVKTMLEGKSREEVITMIEGLAAEHPVLLERLEHEYLRQRKTMGSISKINGKQIRKRIKSIVHSLDKMRPSEAHWRVNGVVEEVRNEIEKARSFIEADEGRNALVYLEAIAEAYLEEWTYLDGSDGQTGDPFEDLGTAFTEALLMVELTRTECREWTAKLQRWQVELSKYGIDALFDDAVAAPEVGWDDPELLDLIAGDEATGVRSWLTEHTSYGDGLIHARLRILDRRGQHDEYLRLAEAAGHLSAYLTMLVRVGRIEEAVSRGVELMSTSDQAHDLAKVLFERGARDEALRIAEYGLTLRGFNMVSTAAWACELANELGHSERALSAALVAFRSLPNLRMYRQVRDLSGQAWPDHRERLLDQLRKNAAQEADCLEIFLEEKLFDDAMAIADRYSRSYDLVRVVVEAVLETHPAWVIRAAKRQAESIIEKAQSELYHHAVNWLAYVCDAYERMNAWDKWRTYVDGLEEQHARKRKLIALMRERFARPRPVRMTRQ